MQSDIVIIDNGTGYYWQILLWFNSYTKMGYAGNNDPAFIIPSAISDKIQKVLSFILKNPKLGSSTDFKNDRKGKYVPQWAFRFLDWWWGNKSCQKPLNQLPYKKWACLRLRSHGEDMA